jgi:hypothetical protein
MKVRIFAIDVKDASGGIIAKDDVITSAAPVFAWMVGKTLKEIKPYIKANEPYKVTELEVICTEWEDKINSMRTIK